MDGEVHQLPRGRHRLTREEVLASQRGRMLTAVADAVAEKGFARMSVADIIKRAGVSRETFYEQFSDKEDCFLAALEAGAQLMLGVLGPSLGDSGGTTLERLDGLLGGYLNVLSEEPSFAKAYLIDAYGAGGRVTERRLQLQQGFVALVTRLLGAESEGDRFAAEAIVAAISSLVTVRVGTGQTATLPELREPLIDLATRLFPDLDEQQAPNQARRRAARP
jgi:AcrR family transcriptional regulator